MERSVGGGSPVIAVGLVSIVKLQQNTRGFPTFFINYYYYGNLLASSF